MLPAPALWPMDHVPRLSDAEMAGSLTKGLAVAQANGCGSRLALGALGFALTAAYCPQIAGAATTPRWTVMALATAILPFMAGQKPAITWAHITGLAFLAYATASLAWSPTLDTHDWLLKLAILAGMFMIGSQIEDMRPFWTGAAVGLSLSGAIIAYDTVAFHYGLPIDRTHGLFVFNGYPAGLFVNGLFYAEAAVLVAIPFAMRSGWLFVLIAPMTMLNTIPRGPIIALIVAGLAWQLARGWRPGLIGCTGIMAASLTGATLLNPQTVALRVAMWTDAIRAFTPLGYGYGSYQATIPFHSANYTSNLEVAPHNEMVGILYELGLPGLFLAVAFCAIVLLSRGASAQYDASLLASVRPARRSGESEITKAPLGTPLNEVVVEDEGVAPLTRDSKYVLIAFLTEAMFGFPLHLPVTAGLFALTAGHISRGLLHWSIAFARRRSPLRTRHEGNRFAGILGPSIASRGDIPLHIPIPDSAVQAAIRARQADAGADTSRRDGA